MNNDDENEITDDDIVKMVTNEECLEEEEPESQTNLIPHSEGFKMLDRALEYVTQQEGTSAADIICLRKLRDIAAKKRAETVKQKTIKDFFKL